MKNEKKKKFNLANIGSIPSGESSRSKGPVWSDTKKQSGEDGGGRPMRPGSIGMARILHSDSRARKGFNQIRDMIKSIFNI